MSELGRLLIYGHRGASADHPENTLEAFHGAREQGADGVELDVRLAADDSLIVHHDAWYRDGRTLWSTPAGDRPDGVPLLDETLDACRDLRVNVEIKNLDGDLGDGVAWSLEPADAVVALLRSRRRQGLDDDADGAVDDVIVSSFDERSLDRVRELAPELPTGLLVLDLNADPQALERAAGKGHSAFHPWDPFVGPELLDRCRGLGLELNTWTVDEHDRIQDLAVLGVDGIITNVPAVARRALGRS
jgi:glycerophosphoryl diester phosphodiesterase